jgi:Xaa-Pro aminopeptidase
MAPTTLPPAEFEGRIERVREKLARTDRDTCCLFSATAIEWVSGFHHLQTERPVCLAVTDEAVAITVPRLERDRAESDAFPLIDRIHGYYDYPGVGDGPDDAANADASETYHEHRSRTPEATIRAMLDGLGAERVAADADGAPGHWGYSGPSLAELAGVDVETVEWITDWRKTKSGREVDLLRRSAEWGNLAHRKLTAYVEPGRHELRVAKRASLDASMAMLDTLGERYDSRLRGGFPASCGFLSGPNTALPHGLTENRRLDEGDVLITGATANVGGYVSELERTMFLGEPGPADRERFEAMLAAQTTAIEESGPGVACAHVDGAVHDTLADRGFVEYARHHTGHNIGLEGHERGFIDRGSDEVMRPGHVYTVEPGIYVPGEAGYRHSDTILVTEEGTERLTYFPRSLDENVIPVR